MNDNLPATTKSQTPTLGLLPDAKLSELLLSGDSPVVGPKSAAALRALIEQPDPPLASQPQVETMIGKLAMATAQAKVSEAEAEVRFEMYWMALRDLPLDDLRAAFVELVRTATFLPTPAEVRSATIRQGALRRYAKSRARHLVWKHETEWKPEQKDWVDPAEVHALLAAANE
jgi:hypothetical protein